MGTNFYCRHIPTAKEHEEMQKRLAGKRYDELVEYIQNIRKEYHIGKRSYGWQFLFSPTPWGHSKKEIDEFLHQDNLVIYDEYGVILPTPEAFWEEIKDCLYRDKNHINAEDYEREHLELPRFAYRQETSPDGLRFSDTWDFC